jgi:membrane-bound lytic murein transglycosylase F
MYRFRKERLLPGLVLGAVFATGYGCVDQQAPWERINRTGHLRFATIESPLTCYRTPVGLAGIECELAKRFAREAGVELTLIMVHDPYEVMQLVAQDRADIGAAGVMDRMVRADLSAGPPWYHVPLQLVYRGGPGGPVNIESLGEERVPVTPDQVEMLKLDFPRVHWQAVHNQNIGTLLRMVHEGGIRATVADAYQFMIYRHLYPDLRIASRLTGPQPVSWIYRHDDELNSRIAAFINEQSKNGELARLLEQYFGHVARFDFSNTSTFLTMTRKRLPLYEKLFRESARRYNVDWTLLAAMSYQESHWFPEARSPTGVRGLMMLTQDTAGDLEIGDRVDPRQSVEGGARYFRSLLDKLPDRISDPDRTWLALAAYNIGYQHLEDARILTQKSGGDPDAWRDVRKFLPLLSDDHWHVQTEYGQARGGEAVRYVKNIRIYQDILRWTYSGEEKKQPAQRDWSNWVALSPVSLDAM